MVKGHMKGPEHGFHWLPIAPSKAQLAKGARKKAIVVWLPLKDQSIQSGPVESPEVACRGGKACKRLQPWCVSFDM